MAITTSSSISVKPRQERKRPRDRLGIDLMFVTLGEANVLVHGESGFLGMTAKQGADDRQMLGDSYRVRETGPRIALVRHRAE
jgi:hypothetical protein